MRSSEDSDIVKYLDSERNWCINSHLSRDTGEILYECPKSFNWSWQQCQSTKLSPKQTAFVSLGLLQGNLLRLENVPSHGLDKRRSAQPLQQGRGTSGIASSVKCGGKGCPHCMWSKDGQLRVKENCTMK